MVSRLAVRAAAVAVLVACTAAPPSTSTPASGGLATDSGSSAPATRSTEPRERAGEEDGRDGDRDGHRGGGSKANGVPGRSAVVTRVVDGDTVEVRFRGRSIDVRLIGVDTPETVDPFEPVECYGPEASRFIELRLEGERVRLEFDVERLDRYRRTLAYAWRGRDLFNRTLVRRGFATVSTYPPNVRYVDRFRAAQRTARMGDVGMWGACGAGGGGGGTGDGGGGGACEPSYPGVCIPPPPPDLDCADVPYDHFVVAGDDPHGFDGDRDGVGCEA